MSTLRIPSARFVACFTGCGPLSTLFNPRITLVLGLIRWSLWWCRYDRKIAGRKARTPDVYDYRSNMKKQMLSVQGAAPTDRSDPRNAWIDWTTQAGDDPCELASALEETGITLAKWCDL